MNFELKIVAQDEKNMEFADAATTALNLLLDHNPDVDMVLNQMVATSLNSAAIVKKLPPCDCDDCKATEAPRPEAVAAVEDIMRERDVARKQRMDARWELEQQKRFMAESDKQEAKIRAGFCKVLFGSVEPTTITWEQILNQVEKQQEVLRRYQDHDMRAQGIQTTTQAQLNARIRRGNVFFQ